MLKVTPPEGYPPEEGRYARGNDFSPVAVCVILDDFDFKIPLRLQELVMAGLDTGAALSGMLQTENVGTEKMLCNIIMMLRHFCIFTGSDGHVTLLAWYILLIIGAFFPFKLS